MENLKSISKIIKKLYSSASKWSYDERFNTVLLTLDPETADTDKDKISTCFQNIYDTETKNKASKPEQKLINSLSGINDSQMLFTSNENGIILYCAWWPWGDKSKVSLRMGLFSLDENLLNEAESITIIKDWFNVS